MDGCLRSAVEKCRSGNMKPNRMTVWLLVFVLACIFLSLNLSDSNRVFLGKAVIPLVNVHILPTLGNATENYTVIAEATEQPLSTKNKTYPRQIVLWTSWRSGSTFTGRLLLQAFNDIFYSYEPLHMRGVKIIQEEKEIESNVQLMKNLLHCEIDKIPEYVSYMFKTKFLLKMNPYLEKYLQTKKSRSIETVKQACQNASLHFGKLIRLPVASARKFLEDPSEDIRVVHMIRDPRGVFNSRRKLIWCLRNESCSNIDTMCSILWKDVQQIKQLRKDFPTKYMFIRYEDISLQVEEKVREMYDFLSLPFTKGIQKYLEKATHEGRKTKSSTSTYNHTFAWRDEIPFGAVKQIQSACSKSLDSLGYRSFDSIKDLRNRKLTVLGENIFDLPTYEVHV